MKSLSPATRLLLCGGVLGLASLASLPISASDKDELASAQRMIVQVQASLERARVAAAQALGALFIIGDDSYSRQWLHQNEQQLSARNEAGLVVC